MHEAVDLLLPRPRRLLPIPGVYRPATTGDTPAARLCIEAPGAIASRLRAHARRLLGPAGLKLDPTAASEIRLRLGAQAGGPLATRDESYRLRVDPTGASAEASSEHGLRYALVTLGQWLGLSGGRSVPAIEVDDRPQLAHRGVLLDISRDQVPTLASLEQRIDRLAAWKINQLQLYTEHTFAYRDHQRVWRGASPLTAEQIRQLDQRCQDRGIELVPNQNSFGHLHRWLVHEPYRRLAECPEGIEHPFSQRREPFSLCPIDAGSLALLADLYQQLLPCFASRQLNAGLDETFDLGLGRSRAACAARGRGRVYLDFVRQVRDLAAGHGHRLQMWGDMALEHPQCLDDLPADITLLAWGYEADHPFAEQAQRLALSGRSFYLCPGTSSWLSFAGRSANAISNLAAAARAASDSGADGYLICDWGDRGHLQPWVASLPGLAAGADFAWNAARAEQPQMLPLAALLDHHGFSAPEHGLGALVTGLGNTDRHLGTRAFNSSPLFHLLASPRDALSHRRYDGLDGARIDAARAHATGVATQLRETAPGGDALARAELAWSAAMIALALDLASARLEAGRTTRLGALAAATRHALAQRLDDQIRQRQSLWLKRNRNGGMKKAFEEVRETARLLRQPR